MCPTVKVLFFSALAFLVSGCLGPIARGPRSTIGRSQRAARIPTLPVAKKSLAPAPAHEKGPAESLSQTVRFSPPLKRFRVRSPYGPRGRKFHTGMDLVQSPRGGDPVLASSDGVVEAVAHRGGYGRMILLRHGDKWYTRYAHLRKVTVRLGQSVQRGETIGFVGGSGRATGPHLHFEILTAERKAVDPAPYLVPSGEPARRAAPAIPRAPLAAFTPPLVPAMPVPQKLK